MMKLGIDATFLLNQQHSGGKQQVLFNLLKGFQHLGYAENVHIFAYSYAEDSLRQQIPSAVFHFSPYQKVFPNKTLNDYVFKTFKLNRMVKEYQIDVLLFPHYNTGLRKLTIPTVVIPHDIQVKSKPEEFSLKDRLLYGIQYHFDFKLRSKIVAISAYDQVEIEKYYPAYQSKVVRIYNPINTDIAPQTEIPGEKKPYICTLNIAYIHKNTITLIKAFQRIMHLIEHDLVLIGRLKPETEFLCKYIKDNKLENRVRLTGFVEENKMNELLCGSELFVNPSMFEGFGMTVVEAAIRRVPVISSKTGATMEVSRGLLHYYEPADDYIALAAKILKVLNNRDSLQQLDKIKNEFMECYDYIKISQDYIRFFEELYRENCS